MDSDYEKWDGKSPLKKGTDGIRVKGYSGRWYVIDESDKYGPRLFLLESEEDGDECAHLVVDIEANPVWDGCYNDWEDLDEAVESGGVMFVKRLGTAGAEEWKIYREVGWNGAFG